MKKKRKKEEKKRKLKKRRNKNKINIKKRKGKIEEPVNAVDWNFAIVEVVVAFVADVASLNAAVEFDSVDSQDVEYPNEFHLD